MTGHRPWRQLRPAQPTESSESSESTEVSTVFVECFGCDWTWTEAETEADPSTEATEHTRQTGHATVVYWKR